MAEATTAAEALAVRRAAREVVSATKIQTTLDRLAAEIGSAIGASDPVVVPIMHGGMFTAYELARRWTFPCMFDYVHLSRYRGGLRGGGIEWRVRPDERLEGRTVLVVDDILDRGVTLAALCGELRTLGVARVYSVVLVVKALDDAPARPAPDFTGLTVGDQYVFGCGMDYKGYWRGLPALYAVA